MPSAIKNVSIVVTPDPDLPDRELELVMGLLGHILDRTCRHLATAMLRQGLGGEDTLLGYKMEDAAAGS